MKLVLRAARACVVVSAAFVISGCSNIILEDAAGSGVGGSSRGAGSTGAVTATGTTSAGGGSSGSSTSSSSTSSASAGSSLGGSSTSGMDGDGGAVGSGGVGGAGTGGTSPGSGGSSSGSSPTVLATEGAFALAIDATDVYFADCATPGTVRRVSKSGGAVTILATDQDQPCALTVDGASVYWLNQGTEPSFDNGTVVRVPKGGGASGVLAIRQQGPQSLAVDATSLYWTTWNDGTVHKADLDGKNPTTLFQAGGLAPGGVAVDESGIYWGSSDGRVRHAALDGSGAEVIATSGPAASPWNLNGVAVDANDVYWTDWTDGRVWRAPKAPLGGVQPGSVLAMALGVGANSLTVDGRGAHWAYIDWSGFGAVMSLPEGGGAAPRTIAAENPTPVAVAIDATTVYFTTEDGRLESIPR